MLTFNEEYLIFSPQWTKKRWSRIEYIHMLGVRCQYCFVGGTNFYGKRKRRNVKKSGRNCQYGPLAYARNCPHYIAKAASWAIRKEIKNITVHDFLALQNKGEYETFSSNWNISVIELILSQIIHWMIHQSTFCFVLWIFFWYSCAADPGCFGSFVRNQFLFFF